MNNDIRIATSFPTHPKTIMLIAKLGLDGVWALIRLWVFAAKHRPDGALRNLNADAIRIACGYPGSIADFIRVLKEPETKFLDADTPEGWLVLHDWKDHNPYAYYAKDRSERAKELARLRWGPKKGEPPAGGKPPVGSPPPSPDHGGGTGGPEKSPGAGKERRTVKPKKPTDPRVKEAVDYFSETCTTAKGFKPEIAGGKDGAIVKKSLESLGGLDGVKKCIDFFLTHPKSEEHTTLSAALSPDTITLFRKNNVQSEFRQKELVPDSVMKASYDKRKIVEAEKQAKAKGKTV